MLELKELVNNYINNNLLNLTNINIDLNCKMIDRLFSKKCWDF